jgi:hypothetical protein
MRLTRYTAKKNRHNFRPFMPLPPKRGVEGFLVEFIFGETAWYDAKALGIDQWNKLLGITQAFTPNNWNACMAAFMPTPEPGLMAVAGYVNYPGREKDWRRLGEIECGTRGCIECFFEDGLAKFEHGDMKAALPFRPPALSRQTGMYFGGRKKTPHWMEIQADIFYYT